MSISTVGRIKVANCRIGCALVHLPKNYDVVCRLTVILELSHVYAVCNIIMVTKLYAAKCVLYYN